MIDSIPPDSQHSTKITILLMKIICRQYENNIMENNQCQSVSDRTGLKFIFFHSKLKYTQFFKIKINILGKL